MQHQIEEDEIVPLPENLVELGELIETITDPAKYKEATTLYNKLAKKKVYSTTLKTTKEQEMATAKKVAPAKKVASKKVAAEKAVVKKAAKKAAPVKKAVTKKTAVAKAPKVAKVKAAKTENFIPVRKLNGDMGREGSAKNAILTMYITGKYSVEQMMAAGPYPKNTVLGAIFHAIRTTPYGIKGKKEAKAKK